MADITGAGQRAPAGAALALTPSARLRRRAYLALALAWAVIVVAIYYRQLWILLAAGPSAWSRPELGQSLRYTGIPFLHEAVSRAASGIGAAVLVVLAVWTCGRSISRWIVPADANAGERRVIELGTGVGVFAYALFVLALSGWFVPPVVAACTAALASAGCLIAAASMWRAHTSGGGGTGGKSRFLRDGAEPFAIESHTRRAGEALGRQSQAPGWTDHARSPWVWLTLVACGIALLCALAPEREYDALWYHLELPRRWLQAGRPVDDVNEYVSLYPLTWELLYGAALSLDADVGAKLVHWITLPLSAAIAGWLAGRIDQRTPPALAWAVTVTAPTVLWEATTAYVDLALAFHAALAVYALVRADGGGSRRWLAVAAVQLGLCCATKHLGLVILAATLIVWVGARMRTRRLGAGTIRTAASICVAALLVPAPWYIRCFIASGNPVFPELYGVFGAWPPERWNASVEQALSVFKESFGRSRTVAHMAALPWDMTMHAARYYGTFGPMLLAFLPFTLASVVRSPTARALGAGSVIYVAFWASPISSFQMRFLVPFWVIAAPIVASGIQRLVDAAGSVQASLRTLTTGAIVVLLALNLPPATMLHERDRVGWSGWLTHVMHDLPIAVVAGGMSRQDYLDRQVRSAAAWRWINVNTPKGARILTFPGGDQFLADRARLRSETPVARQVTWDATSGDTDAVVRRLRRLGIEYVLVQKPLLRTPAFERLDLLQPALLASSFEVAYEDFWMVVYRLRPADAAAGTTEQR